MTDIVYRQCVGESDLPQIMALVQSELVENLEIFGLPFWAKRHALSLTVRTRIITY